MSRFGDSVLVSIISSQNYDKIINAAKSSSLIDSIALPRLSGQIDQRLSFLVEQSSFEKI